MKLKLLRLFVAAVVLATGVIMGNRCVADDGQSALACATTVFSQPNVRFMHKVRAVNPGAKVSVKNLPKGLRWNAERCIVDGRVKREGKYTYQIVVNEGGKVCEENVSLTVSSRLPLAVPFMGWLSWNSVQDEVSDSIVRAVVDLFKEKGLYECGWRAVMLDDWWHATQRAADGAPQPNAKRFPQGIAATAKYAHDNGMLFGIYTDAAPNTCAGAFGSYGFEKIDAQTYAKWGVDIVKCDYCNAPEDVATAKVRYRAMADAFREAGYGTILYICEWGEREPWKCGAEVGGSCWRISQDVRDCWTGVGTGEGVVQSIRDMKGISAYQGVNRFNDADMLCIGLHGKGKSSNDLCGGKGPGITQDEYRTQFALWCMWSSPMALSFDPRSPYITEDDYEMLRSKALIALNQDPMGQQADLISDVDGMLVFAKDCENGDIAISVTNMNEDSREVAVDLGSIPGLKAGKAYQCLDAWADKIIGKVRGSISTTVRSHATQVYRLSAR